MENRREGNRVSDNKEKILRPPSSNGNACFYFSIPFPSRDLPLGWLLITNETAARNAKGKKNIRINKGWRRQEERNGDEECRLPKCEKIFFPVLIRGFWTLLLSIREIRAEGTKTEYRKYIKTGKRTLKILFQINFISQSRNDATSRNLVSFNALLVRPFCFPLNLFHGNKKKKKTTRTF